MAKDYKKIKAWQCSHRLTLFVYKMTKLLPKEEIYGLIPQLRRASVSMASNIVEGSNKRTKKEYLKYLYDANASMKEVEYQASLSRELGYIDDIIFQDFSDLYRNAVSCLAGLIKAVETEIKKGI